MKELDLIQYDKVWKLEQTDDQILEKCGRNCMPCMRNTLLPYEYEYTCMTFGYNVMKKNELTRFLWKK